MLNLGTHLVVGNADRRHGIGISPNIVFDEFDPLVLKILALLKGIKNILSDYGRIQSGRDTYVAIGFPLSFPTFTCVSKGSGKVLIVPLVRLDSLLCPFELGVNLV